LEFDRTVELNVDAYGPYARISAIADFLEAAALAGKSTSQIQLSDIIRRNSWSSVQKHAFITGAEDFPQNDIEPTDGDQGEDSADELPEDNPEEWASFTFSILADRADILRDQYPFFVTKEGLTYRSEKFDESDYLRLLSITLAHSYNATVPNVRDIFERVTVGSLALIGNAAAPVGTARDVSMGFIGTLSTAAKTLGFTPAPQPAPRHARARDGKVDAVARLTQHDGRPGQITIVAQATCAKSDQWERKIRDPRADHWMSYLSERVEPLVILTVPHHVQLEHLHYLIGPKQTVMDRLRLTGQLPPITRKEQRVIEWMRKSNWEL